MHRRRRGDGGGGGAGLIPLPGLRALLLVALLAAGTAAHAKDDRPKRYRVTLGPLLVPGYPGADHEQLQPLIGFDQARGDDPFTFHAPDESVSFAFLDRHGFSLGPAFNFQAPRRARDVGAAIPRVGFTLEAGGFVQYAVTPGVRLRAEVRQGIGGHRGLIADVAVDVVARDADRWLVSAGPRVRFVGSRYARSYFGIDPATAARTGLPRYAIDGGIEAVGGTVGALRQLSPRWGVYGFARYDRLIDDPARSPLVARFGSRNQVSGGLGLAYSFTRR